jgi:hypothetical protein
LRPIILAELADGNSFLHAPAEWNTHLTFWLCGYRLAPHRKRIEISVIAPYVAAGQRYMGKKIRYCSWTWFWRACRSTSGTSCEVSFRVGCAHESSAYV